MPAAVPTLAETLAPMLDDLLRLTLGAATHPAGNLAPLDDAAAQLSALLPQLAHLSPAERAALQPRLARLIAALDTGIHGLQANQAETATQLRALQHRSAAISAYTQKK